MDVPTLLAGWFGPPRLSDNSAVLLRGSLKPDTHTDDLVGIRSILCGKHGYSDHHGFVQEARREPLDHAAV